VTGQNHAQPSLDQRQMWKRRFVILQMVAMTGDLPHGSQQRLAERFGVDKAVISRDIAWAQTTGFAGSGLSPLRCSFRRGAVTIEWTNTAVNVIMRNARQLLRAAKRDRLEEP
jgi:predicted DNA-binding transcriptional regulator YafY